MYEILCRLTQHWPILQGQYKGKSGEKRIWRCGKLCQNSGYCEYHEAHLRDKNERRREKYHAKKQKVGVK